MRGKKIFVMTIFCFIMFISKKYATTENSVLYVTKSEKDKIYSSQLKINNLYKDLQPGEYFTLYLIGAEFAEDDNGKLRVYSNSAEFYKKNKTSLTGMFLDDVTDREEIAISFYSKVIDDEAFIEIDAEDSHLTSGTYTYAINRDSSISDKSSLRIADPRFFNETIDLEPIIIEERYSGAFRSLQVYEYQVDELIKIELPKDEYEFYDKEYMHPITIVVGQGKEETRYQVGRDLEIQLSPDRSTLTFKQYNNDVLQSSGNTSTIRIENLRVKAKNLQQIKDVYAKVGGKWLEDETILIAKQVKDKLVVQISPIQDTAKKEQKIKFTMQETNPGTFFKENELSFGLSNNVKIDFRDDFKLELRDGFITFNQDKLKIDKHDGIFTIEEYKRQDPYNLIEIKGEFIMPMPENIEQDIQFLVSAPEIKKVLYTRLLEAENIEDIEDDKAGQDNKNNKVAQFKVASVYYLLGEETHLMDASPYISRHNRIMVPLRYVSYALGVDPENLKWDGSTQTITLKGEKPMTINVKTKEISRNHVINTLSEIELIDGRTFVPVGEIGKAFGLKVTWDGKNKTATFN